MSSNYETQYITPLTRRDRLRLWWRHKILRKPPYLRLNSD